MQLCTAAMVASLAALMNDGVIRRTDPAALAALIAGAATNAAGWAAESEQPQALLDAVGEALDRLLDGLQYAAPQPSSAVASPDR